MKFRLTFFPTELLNVILEVSEVCDGNDEYAY